MVPTLYTEDIGFVLRNITSTHPQLISIYICTFCYDSIACFGFFFIHFILYALLKKEKTAPTFHAFAMFSTVLIGTVIVVVELVLQFSYIRDRNPVNTPGLMSIITIYLFLFVMYFFLFVMYIKWRKIGMLHLTFHVQSILFFMIIHHNALPTFLLMLIYPIQVITIVAYWTAFVYVSIIVLATYLLIFRLIMKEVWKKSIKIRVCACIYFSFLLLYAFLIPLLLILLFPVVYALLLNQSLSITAGPVYTVLSLIPTAAISFVSWMLKTKAFQFEELKNAQNSEDTNEPRAANNDNDQEEERIPLLTVEENGSSTEPARNESSPNLRNRQNYGATNAEDKSSETNC